MASQSPTGSSSGPAHSAEHGFKELPSLPMQIVFPSFDAKQKRVDSLKKIAKHHPDVRIEVLADDGFFYLGHEDYIICFKCKLCLREWMDEDDAAFQHALYDPVCSSLLSSRGDTFVMEVRQSIRVTCQ